MDVLRAVRPSGSGVPLTFVEVDLVPQYHHAFGEQLVLKVLGEEGAQLCLQELPVYIYIYKIK